MAADTYARILGAVGQALDLAEARTFAVSENESGLTLELVDGLGARKVYNLSLADLVDLMSWSDANSAPAPTMSVARDEGMLHRLLESRERELVGAR